MEASSEERAQPSARSRPWWAAAMAFFCAAALAWTVPRDLLDTPARDVEVWLGFEVYGRAARLSAPLHWAIFALGAWGFWRCRPWIWPWASVYAFYVALSHLVWSEVSPNGQGWPMGLLQLAVFSVPALALWRARPPALSA